MHIFRTAQSLINHLNEQRSKGLTIGFVPTMGALHSGHLALINHASRENEVVVVSIFVNPTQFNNPEDLENYPQTLTADLDILEKIANHIIVFAPNIQEMYAENVTSTTYDFDGLDKVMEGAFREGHFDGVGTIVEALLTLVKPTRAYFGEKDYQQLQIIKKLTEIRHIPVEIVGCPIVREENGLAFSSRNERLTENMRKEASFIYRTLTTAKKKFGTESAVYVTEWVTKQFEEHPELELEYIAIAQADTLKPVVKKQKNKKYRAFIAVYTEGVRLIDNIALN